MHVQFKTLAIPTRAAKRIKRLAEITESVARQWTAEVLGYRDWHELGQRVSPRETSPLDEDCAPQDLKARREFQLQRLQACLARAGKGQDSAGEILAQWQPSAAQPQVPVAVRGRPGAASQDSRRGKLALLLVAIHAKPSYLALCVEELLPLLRDCEVQDSLKLATNVAAGLLQRSRELAEKVAARRVLEVVSTKQAPLAWFNLAMSLMMGDAGLKDDKRAVDLLQRLVESAEASAELKTRARSLIASATAEGHGRPADLGKAVAGWQAAAEGGDAEAAFNAALALEGGPNKAASPENTAKAAALYRQAGKKGHVHAATNLGLLLLAHKSLEDYPMESLHWLETAARAGDGNADAALEFVHARERDVLRMLDRGELPEHQVRATFELMERMLDPRKR